MGLAPQRTDGVTAPGSLRTQVTAERCALLRAQPDPAVAALGVLALLSERGEPWFGRLEVTDVADDGAWVRMPGTSATVTVAAAGRGILTAQRRAALAQRPESYENWPLFFNEIGGWAQPQQLRRDLIGVCELLKLPELVSGDGAAPQPGEWWMSNRHLALHTLADYPPTFKPMNEESAEPAG